MQTNQEMMLNEVKFDERGLVPAIAQDTTTKEVLMLAYMNRESLEITLKEKKACYYSRSRHLNRHSSRNSFSVPKRIRPRLEVHLHHHASLAG